MAETKFDASGLRLVSHEPWGAAGSPSPVLELPSPFVIPMNVGLTADRRQMVLLDSVDYYQLEILSKSQAIELADYFRALADAMEDSGDM